MPGRKRNSMYTTAFNKELEIKILDVLNHTREALTIDQIKQRDITMKGITSQKMARVLGNLIEMGFARKGKSKSSGRMLYKAVAVMVEEGYEVDDD